MQRRAFIQSVCALLGIASVRSTLADGDSPSLETANIVPHPVKLSNQGFTKEQIDWMLLHNRVAIEYIFDVSAEYYDRPGHHRDTDMNAHRSTISDAWLSRWDRNVKNAYALSDELIFIQHPYKGYHKGIIYQDYDNDRIRLRICGTMPRPQVLLGQMNDYGYDYLNCTNVKQYSTASHCYYRHWMETHSVFDAYHGIRNPDRRLVEVQFI